MRLQRDVRGWSDPRNDPSGRSLASVERRSIPSYPVSNCCTEDRNAEISLAGSSRLGNYPAWNQGERRGECARSNGGWMNSPRSPPFLRQRRNRCARRERERERETGSRSRDRRFALRLGKSINQGYVFASIGCKLVGWQTNCASLAREIEQIE